MKSTKLLIGITGSITAIHIPVYLYTLLEVFPNIKIIMSRAAENFIRKETVSLIIEDVYTSMFPFSKEARTHIQLAHWADIFIILPATANIIAQAAHGLGETLLSTTILGYENPVIFFPSMNDSMWKNPAMQQNLSLLDKFGHQVISPIQRLIMEHASKEKKIEGSMPLPNEVLSILEKEVNKRKTTQKNANCHV